MEKDELLKRVLMMQRLQGMETEPVSAEDPYASMEKDQLISMIHFLVKREDERAQENQELKDMVKDLRDTHKQDVKTQSNLMKSIDRLTNQVAMFDRHGLGIFIKSAQPQTCMAMLNSLIAIRNNVIHQDASPGLTHQTIKDHKDNVMAFVNLVEADIIANKFVYYNEV